MKKIESAFIVASWIRKILFFLVLFSLALFLSACEEADASQRVPAPLDTVFPIDPSFREFYEFLGGEAVLGPAISPISIDAENVKSQYTEAGLMVFDPSAPPNELYHLAPLGVQLGIGQVSALEAGRPVATDFQPLYERLGGARYIGRALTEVRFNTEKNRLEQFFENLAFYRKDGETQVHLIPYGAMACENDCRRGGLRDATAQTRPVKQTPFAEATALLGTDLTGQALTEPYISPFDGKLEQVFERAVLYADRSNPQAFALRPLAEKLGILNQDMETSNNDPSMSFYALQGERGFNVPIIFWNYIAEHGQFSTIGVPVSGLMAINAHVTRQCFQNICLDYDRNASGKNQVQAAPLGYTYLQIYPQPASSQAGSNTAPEPAPTRLPSPQPLPQPQAPVQPAPAATQPETDSVAMFVWDAYPVVAASQEQEIGVHLSSNNVPISNVQPQLILTLPDGGQETYAFPPTGIDGLTRMHIHPITAPDSTVIPYQVCFTTHTGLQICDKESFIIWNP